MKVLAFVRRVFGRRRPLPLLALPGVSDADLAFVLRHERFVAVWRPGGMGVMLSLKPIVGAPVLFSGTLDHVISVTRQVLADDRVDELALRRDSTMAAARAKS